MNFVLDHIQQLVSTQTMVFDDGREIPIYSGTPQGSKLSPRFFTLYVDHAINSNPWLKKLTEMKRNKGYVDDFAVILDNIELVPETILAWQSIEREYGLKLNLSKCEILVDNWSQKAIQFYQEREGFDQIQIKNTVRYLGVQLNYNVRRMKEICESKIN